MDFSITNLIVVPSTNTVPTTGSPYNLAVGQVGVFKGSDYTAATTSNVANESFIYIAQGRDVNGILPSDRSDKIAKAKLVSYFKATGSDVAANEIWEASNFNVKCGEDVVLTVRAHSFYLDTAFFNGLTRSIVVKAPCCDCGSDPCNTVDQDKIVDLFIEKLSEDFSYNREAVNLTKYFDFVKIGTGSSAKLRIYGKPVQQDKQGSDLALNPYQYDRLWFQVFINKNVDTTADFYVYDKCDVAGDATLIQRSSFPKLTSEEVKTLEKQYYSYKVPNYQQLFRLEGYNPYFKSYVEDGKVYDQYTVTYKSAETISEGWSDDVPIDMRVILLIPNTITDIQAILAAYLGSPTDESGTVESTTTTTSTTSTSTTSTTAVPFP